MNELFIIIVSKYLDIEQVVYLITTIYLVYLINIKVYLKIEI